MLFTSDIKSLHVDHIKFLGVHKTYDIFGDSIKEFVKLHTPVDSFYLKMSMG